MQLKNIKKIGVVLFLIMTLTPCLLYSEEGENSTDISQLWNDWLKDNANVPIPNMKKLEEIREIILNNGIKSHPYLTNALIREAKRRAEKNPDVALRMLELFEDQYNELSPDPFILSALIYLKNKKQFSTAIDKFINGVRIYFINSIYTLGLLANIMILMFVSFVIVAILTVITMFVKYLKLPLHDFCDLFPSFVPRFATWLFGLLLLLLPIIFKTSPIIIILIWAAVITSYITNKERIVIYGIAFLLILLPFIINFLGSFIIGPFKNGINELELIRLGYFDEKNMNKLEKLQLDFPSNNEFKYALALIYKKSGRFEDALKIYETMVNNNKYRGAVLNNMGNIYIVMGKIDDAIQLYRTSLTVNPNSSEAHFNLGQALILKDPLGTEGVKEIDRAKELSPAKISYYIKIFDGKNMNRRAIDIPLERWDIIKEFFRFSPEKIELISPMIPTVFKLKNEWSASLFGFILIVIVLVISLLKNRKAIFSTYCIKCNSVVCPRCSLNQDNVKYCNDCLQIYIEKAGNQKDIYRHEKKIARRNYLKKIALGVINTILPGTGSIYNGYTFSGIFFLTLLLMIFIRIITGTSLIAYNLNLIYIPPLFFNIIFIGIMLLFYVIAQMLYYRSER